MKLLVAVISALLSLITLFQSEVSAFTHGPFHLGSIKSGGRSGALMSTVSYSATEIMKRQISLYKKQPIIVVVEKRRSPLVAVQSVLELEDAAKSSGRSTISKTICSRSGGYPDFEVKDGIYGLLWASLSASMTAKITDDLNQEKTVQADHVPAICESC